MSITDDLKKTVWSILWIGMASGDMEVLPVVGGFVVD